MLTRRSSERAGRRGGIVGRRAHSGSANRCEFPQHIHVIVLTPDDVTQRGPVGIQPHDWAAAAVPQPGENPAYVLAYHSFVVESGRSSSYYTSGDAARGFTALQKVLQVL